MQRMIMKAIGVSVKPSTTDMQSLHEEATTGRSQSTTPSCDDLWDHQSLSSAWKTTVNCNGKFWKPKSTSKTGSWIVGKNYQNAPKVTIWRSKLKKISGEKHCPLPTSLPQWRGDTPSPHPNPLGASTLAHAALDLGSLGLDVPHPHHLFTPPVFIF